jgi:hypothetical protein
MESDDNGECDEIGFAYIKLNEVVDKASCDVETIQTECFSTSYPHELIAFLNVKISGLKTLQKLARMK